jgi:hypothetical protein
MYRREISAPKASPVENGIPITGTWNRAFEKVDLLEIQRPYNYPLPRWVRNWRIKEWQYFNAQNNSYLFEALFYNLKVCRIAQVLLYDKENGEKFLFREITPYSGWQLPSSLSNASIYNHSSGFFFRIHSWLDTDTVKLDINIEASRRRPSLTAHLAYNLNAQELTPMAVSMGIANRRIIYVYKAFAPVQGDMVFGGKRISLKQENCSGFFCDYKGFYPYRMQTTICNAMGFDGENRRFGFHIAENQTGETNKNNENALWINGKLTPLPAVLITMPNGPDSDWVIQDVEGMVDLTFTPKEINKSGKKLIVTKAEFNSPLGYYNGMLVNSEGEQTQIKNLFGMGEKFNIRM